MVDGGYSVGSMFAGIGGICLAFKDAGAKVVWANEINTDACRTYRNYFGDGYLVEGDIYNVKVSADNYDEVPHMDILTAGFPCQAFSIAGYRKGFEDSRGILFFEVMRIIKARRPRAVFLENVKNLVTHDSGNTFKNIVQCLEEEGYNVSFRIMNTMEFGNIPQNRERVYVVAFSDPKDAMNFNYPDRIELDVRIGDIVDQSAEAPDYTYYREGSRYYDAIMAGLSRRDTIYQWRRKYLRENKSQACPTLTANMGGGGHNVPLIMDDYGIRKLTPQECLRFQGFPKDFDFPDISRSSQYMQAGNSVSVPVVRRIAESMIVAMRETDREGSLSSSTNVRAERPMSTSN